MFRANGIRLRPVFAIALAVAVLVAVGDACHAQTSLLAGQTDREAAAERTILAALDRTVVLKFVNTPLQEVAAAMQRALGVPIVFDQKSLEENDIRLDVPITFGVPAISARSALDSILSPKDLDWIVQGELLIITSSDKVKATVTTRVYPVVDLVFTETNDAYEADFDSLIELITSTVWPASWDIAGGAGSIASFAPSGALVVSQTRQNHEQIELLLARMRQVRDLQEIPVGMKFANSSYYREVREDASGVAAENASAENAASAATAHPDASGAQWRIPRVYH